jgi:hypothetical protein
MRTTKDNMLDVGDPEMKVVDPLQAATGIVPSPDEFLVPVVLLMVLSHFHHHDISYCYWKSSRRLRHVFSGEADMDLLVARKDQHRAEMILSERGFKRFSAVASRDHPPIVSFLGYDEAGGRLIHLHLHFRLIIGERLLKNYCIPWEEAILARAIVHPTVVVRILDPATEALLLIVRACLEMRRSDPITLRDWQETKRKFALDRADLMARVDRTTLCNRATELFPADVSEMLVRAFYDERPLEHHRRLRRRLQDHFAPYRTYNSLEARLRSMGRTIPWVAGSMNKRFFHFPRSWNRRAPGGGWLIAVVGVDGSGKTTIVAAIREWLANEVDVLPIYFGTGDGRPSLLLWPLKPLAILFTRLFKTKPKGASHGPISTRTPGKLYAGLLVAWSIVVAMEKRIKLLAARRGANRGLIVLADRYPQNEILGFNDGPLLTRLIGVPHWLRRFEADTYALAQRLHPDLVIKLEVTPETAARREPIMDPTVIRERIEAIPRLAFPGAKVVCVDAEQPLADVIGTVKREVWRLL